MLNLLACRLENVATMPGKIAHLAGLVFRLIAGFENTIGMKQHEPFVIGLIGLFLGDILHFVSVDEDDINAGILQLEEKMYPVDACRLHRSSVNATIDKPFADLIEVTGKAAESAVVVPIPVDGNTYLHLGIGNVYACCVRIHDF